MLSIRDITTGEFFDIPGVSLEIERNNPYLGTDEISGESSLPINISYTDKNYRLMQYYGNFYRKNQKLVIAVEIFDNGNYKYTGNMVVQQHSSSMTLPSSTVWVALVTFNSSAFFQEAKTKNLHEIDLGGERSYAWTSSNPSDGSGGFWQHIHEARTPNAFDYTFYPVRNPSWYPWEFTDSETRKTLGLNLLGAGNNFYHPVSGDYSLHFNATTIVPMIYVPYILRKIFDAVGWKLTGDILEDEGFKRLTMVGTRAIPYKRGVPLTSILYDVDPVTYDLRDYVTQGVSVFKFIIDFKNRFGWKFTFNSNTRTATLSSLKSNIGVATQNWTRWVLAEYKADYKEAAQNYSLITNIDSNDSYPLSAETENVPTIPSVDTLADLPDPTTVEESVICYVFEENTWYQNYFDFTENTLTWEPYSHNVGSRYEPDPSIRIESDISTMPTIKTVIGSDLHEGLLPASDYQGNHIQFPSPYINLGMRMLFYHGMRKDSAGADYPYASCHSTDYEGNNDLTPWSIPFKREHGAVNNGVYDVWYKDWLEYIKSDDVRTMRFQLPYYILAQFDWNTNIRVNDVDFVPVSYKEILPYPGVVEFKLKRVS